MGTNYYLVPIPAACACCGREFPERHIGKSSGGWCFTLHIYPDEGINTLDDWRKLFTENYLIKDEYGEYIEITEMLACITERKWNVDGKYAWSEYDLKRNHAVNGPNGLVRHELSHFCIGHGEGAWDYCVGEFS